APFMLPGITPTSALTWPRRQACQSVWRCSFAHIMTLVARRRLCMLWTSSTEWPGAGAHIIFWPVECLMATLDDLNDAKLYADTRTTAAVAAPPSSSTTPSYTIHLSIFEGPLDLLLHLIERRQMEITAISLVAVTDQFLEYVRSWQEEEPPMARLAEFITVGAKLLFIK